MLGRGGRTIVSCRGGSGSGWSRCDVNAEACEATSQSRTACVTRSPVAGPVDGEGRRPSGTLASWPLFVVLFCGGLRVCDLLGLPCTHRNPLVLNAEEQRATSPSTACRSSTPVPSAASSATSPIPASPCDSSSDDGVEEASRFFSSPPPASIGLRRFCPPSSASARSRTIRSCLFGCRC